MKPNLRVVALAVLLVVAVVLALQSRGPGGVEAPPPAPQPAPAPQRAPTPPGGPVSQAGTDPVSGLPWVSVANLPAEARDTIRRIDAGGPFRYRQDDQVFGNRERLLPTRPRGTYREYTVLTPGSDDRGARRIVAADGGRVLYYTDDHYASFRVVRR